MWFSLLFLPPHHKEEMMIFDYNDHHDDDGDDSLDAHLTSFRLQVFLLFPLLMSPGLLSSYPEIHHKVISLYTFCSHLFTCCSWWGVMMRQKKRRRPFGRMFRKKRNSWLPSSSWLTWVESRKFTLSTYGRALSPLLIMNISIMVKMILMIIIIFLNHAIFFIVSFLVCRIIIIITTTIIIKSGLEDLRTRGGEERQRTLYTTKTATPVAVHTWNCPPPPVGSSSPSSTSSTSSPSTVLTSLSTAPCFLPLVRSPQSTRGFLYHKKRIIRGSSSGSTSSSSLSC